jgi:uncharacterized membrane protein
MIKPKVRLHILFSIFVPLWCAGIIAAPLLKNASYITSSNTIYSFFSRICHQDETRSFHIEGEKLSVCIRCSAIYFGSFLGLLLVPLCRYLKKVRVPVKIVFLAAIFPMLIDVVLNDFNLHVSNTTTRVITGALFGMAALWWTMPLFIEACLQLIQKKKNRSLNSGVNCYAGETQ